MLRLLGSLVHAVASAAGSPVVGCPAEACDPARTGQIGSDPAGLRTLPVGPLAPLWAWRPTRLVGAAALRCGVAETGGVVCTGGDGGVVSLSTATGQTIWNITDYWLSGAVGFPLLSVGGGAIVSDGTALVGVDDAGTPLGPVIPIRMPSPVYSLGLTLENVIPLVSIYGACAPKCGWLVTYLSDGIPHASDWLNDTSTGQCYAATSMPIVSANHTSGELTSRIYIPTAVVDPQNHPQSHPSTVTRCRLVAEDVSSTMNNRLSRAWHFDYFCTPPPAGSARGTLAMQLPSGGILLAGTTTLGTGTRAPYACSSDE